MTNSPWLAQIEEFAKSCCDQYPGDPGLWRNHVQLVRQFALRLAEIEGADSQVVEIAALLHDVGSYKGREEHHIWSYELSKELLEGIDLPEITKELILECVLKHRTRFASEDNRIEVKIIQSADALGTLFDDEWQEYSQRTMSRETLSQLYAKALGKINLESARRLAEPQIAKLNALLPEEASPPSPLDLEQIRQRYAGKAVQEWERLLSTPIMRIEYLITTSCLERHLPGTGLILDAGSGPGRYAIDLAQKGYQVVMYDLLDEMLQLGQEKVTESGMGEQVKFVEGDIASLPYHNDTFDAVISLGAPISHITDPSARSSVVAEMSRVVKPSGKVILTGMARTACYRAAIFWFKQHPEFFEQITTDNFHSRGIMDGSQVWYNFAPGELEKLAESYGLQVIDRVGCEGLANHLPAENLEQIEANERYWPVWKEILLETCNEPSIIGISNHLMVTLCKF